MSRIGGYSRISLDDDGDALGVQRQMDDITALVERKGHTLAKHYIDNNISAFKARVIRPDFEQLLVDLGSGLIDGIAVWDCDRLARKPKDLERVIDLYDERTLVFLTAQADIDLSTPDGRFMARLMVNFASKSSADMSRRQKRKQLELAQSGKVAGGGTRPFGYEPDRRTVCESEAVVIRDAAHRVLAGESLTSICNSFNQSGVLTALGRGKWDRGVLKRVLTGPRIAGLRVYHGALMIGPDGSSKAEWDAILDLPTWETVCEILNDPRREISQGRIDRHYLLSGFLRCKCGAKMYGVMKHGKPNYQCPIDRGCNKTCRMGEPIDAHVTELVLRYLESQDVQAEPEPEDTDKTEALIETAEKSLANLIAEWDAGRVSDAVFFTAQAKKESTINELKRGRTIQRRARTMRAPVGQGVRQIWTDANLSQRRAILSDVLLAVQVLPKPTTAPKRFDARYYVPVPQPSVSL